MRQLLMVAVLVLVGQTMAGPAVDEGIGKGRQLLADVDGWRVYRARNGNIASCFAYKVAEGESVDDVLVSGSGMAVGMLGGNARGLKLYIADGSDEYEIRLFGRELYVGVTALEAGGKIWNSVHDLTLQDLLSLDGQRVAIEITTYRTRLMVGGTDRFSGFLDVTGVRAAHAALEECRRIRKEL